MTELDAYFGPRKPPPTRRRKTGDELLAAAFGVKNTWRCEEPIKPMLTKFAELWPECVPRGSKSGLYASARDLLPEVGEQDSAAFVEWAHGWLRRKAPELTVKNLRSLMFLVPKWRKQGRNPYTEGEYAEYIE